MTFSDDGKFVTLTVTEYNQLQKNLQDFQQATAKLQAEKRESLSALRSAITVLQGRGGGLAPSSHPADCHCTVCYSRGW